MRQPKPRPCVQCATRDNGSFACKRLGDDPAPRFYQKSYPLFLSGPTIRPVRKRAGPTLLLVNSSLRSEVRTARKDLPAKSIRTAPWLFLSGAKKSRGDKQATEWV